VLALPYVGCNVRASALAASKPHAKVHFRDAGLPLAREAIVMRGEDPAAAARSARVQLGGSVVVKPAGGGSAIGVTRVSHHDDDDALIAAVTRALQVDDQVLIEEWVFGREVTCGILDVDDAGPRALPPTLITSRAADWYDFTSRYASGGSAHQCPAPFAPPLLERIQSIAVQGFRALGARDLGRLDFVVTDDGSVTLLELNTLPGMTATSLFPEAARAAGISFPDLCSQLVDRAASRPPRAAPDVVPMPP
jgi:D-alanine-D-alanine ligase